MKEHALYRNFHPTHKNTGKFFPDFTNWKYYTTYTGKKVLVIKEYSFSFSTYFLRYHFFSGLVCAKDDLNFFCILHCPLPLPFIFIVEMVLLHHLWRPNESTE